MNNQLFILRGYLDFAREAMRNNEGKKTLSGAQMQYST
jgi:hypothetical protein